MSKAEQVYVGKRFHPVWHVSGPDDRPICNACIPKKAIYAKALRPPRERLCENCKGLMERSNSMERPNQ